MKTQNKPLLHPSVAASIGNSKECNGRLVATISPEVDIFLTQKFPKKLKSRIVDQVLMAFMDYHNLTFANTGPVLSHKETTTLLSNFFHFISSQATYTRQGK